jgi:heat shock protein HslJ
MKRPLTVLLLALALATTAGCADLTTTGVPSEETGAAAEQAEAGHSEGTLEGTSWVLTEAGGEAQAALEGFEVTASFLEGTLSGQAPVNRYSAEVEMGAAGELTVGPVAATKMAGPPEAMEAEAAYFALLAEVTGYAEQGESLQLLAGAEPVLTFAPDAAVSIEEPGTDPMGPDAAVVALAETLVGMPLDEAEAAIEEAGYTARVLSVDGEGGPATTDFRTDRINLVVVDDEVTQATVG